jgi:hypothetical protein
VQFIGGTPQDAIAHTRELNFDASPAGVGQVAQALRARRWNVLSRRSIHFSFRRITMTEKRKLAVVAVGGVYLSP